MPSLDYQKAGTAIDAISLQLDWAWTSSGDKLAKPLDLLKQESAHSL
ncbi:hypothetical protein LRP50_14175 [Enterovibrio sp. ZSDZ42]|uniref:Uncharacterized protein n=1 Tax=Enterovibrio gelatinilyticus TaxID=2899819 RepID=A0ABT5R1Y6_9GAMM|nr:hypothetical protein [Enterovibrio sp. ZSDZ42]MDD1794285.1 hypothetical protein [Enterovibrio sp. ZSDZ42]